MPCPYIIEFAVKHHSCVVSPCSLKANVHAAAEGDSLFALGGHVVLVIAQCLTR